MKLPMDSMDDGSIKDITGGINLLTAGGRFMWQCAWHQSSWESRNSLCFQGTLELQPLLRSFHPQKWCHKNQRITRKNPLSYCIFFALSAIQCAGKNCVGWASDKRSTGVEAFKDCSSSMGLQKSMSIYRDLKENLWLVTSCDVRLTLTNHDGSGFSAAPLLASDHGCRMWQCPWGNSWPEWCMRRHFGLWKS